jgi:hypothetical protein
MFREQNSWRSTGWWRAVIYNNVCIHKFAESVLLVPNWIHKQVFSDNFASISTEEWTIKRLFPVFILQTNYATKHTCSSLKSSFKETNTYFAGPPVLEVLWGIPFHTIQSSIPVVVNCPIVNVNFCWNAFFRSFRIFLPSLLSGR